MTATLNPNLHAYIDATLKYFKAPSAAITVVKGDETVLETFGTLEAGGSAMVSNQTMFPAGACTRAYTAAATALLVDRGALGWDDRVHVHLPEFSLPDPWISKNLTLRDLLGQRIALEARTSNPLELTEQGGIAGAVRIAGFRERYTSLPLAYSVMAEIMTRISGLPFAEFLETNLLRPLGLERTLVAAAYPNDPDQAQPHVRGAEGATPLDPTEYRPRIGDTGLFTSATDNAIWLRLHLRRGYLDRTPVVKWTSMVEIITPQIIAEPDERRGEQFADYCLGWRAADYGGTRILYHEGHGQGSSALNLLLPRENLGVAVQLGLECPAAARAITYRLLDAFLGRSAVDWAPKFKAWAEEDKAAQAS